MEKKFSFDKTFIKNEEIGRTLIIALLVLNLIIVAYATFFKKDALWLETVKAGGSDNFKMVQELYNSDTYKSQQTQSLQSYLAQINGNKGNTADQVNPTADTTKDSTDTQETDGSTLSKAQINQILDGAHYQGKKSARIVLIEYSDLLCPFCKRHYNNQTLETAVKNHPSDVALVFKNMPLAQLHPTAPIGANAVECAGKLGGTTKYYDYLAKAFALETFDDNNVVEAAKQVGLNEAKFSACVQDSATTDAVNASIQEGQTIFGINGTPGNVILDTKTGKYVVIAGAYPLQSFEDEITKMLK